MVELLGRGAQPYVKVTALEVPLAVVITTCAEAEVDGGTVTVQVF